jgi:hypothetical protein
VLIGGVIAFCILVLIAAFLAPRGSRHLERAGTRPLAKGQNTSSKAPGKLGKWLSKPFGTSRKAIHKSGSTGRRGRSKLPL